MKRGSSKKRPAQAPTPAPQEKVARPPAKLGYGPHLLLAALTAVLLLLAFPSPGLSILAHLALVPLTLAAAWTDRPRRLFATAWLMSFVWWLYMISWLIPVTGGGFAGLAAYMAIYWPCYAVAWRAIDGRYRLPAALSVPLVWVSFEFIRGTWLQNGFGWYALSQTQAPFKESHGAVAIIQVADLFGEWTVSFLVAMSNGMLVDLIRWRFGTSRDRQGADDAANTLPKESRSRIRWGSPLIAALQRGSMGFLLWFLMLIASMLYGQLRIDGLEREGKKGAGPQVSIAVIQTNVSQDNKMRPPPGQMEKDWARMLELTQQALRAEPKPSIIVWPETMVPVPLNREALVVYTARAQAGRKVPELAFFRAIEQIAKENNVHLFVGSPSIIPDPFKQYNSAFHYLPDGTQNAQRYDKIFRVPFGEYIPWIENWPWLKELFLEYVSPYGKGNDYSLTPGDAFLIFKADAPGPQEGSRAEVRIAVPICFEDTIARACRPLVYGPDGKRCDILINLTNDGWFGETNEGIQHFQNSVYRCIENRVPMARSVNTGVSGFIDSVGRVQPLTGKDGRLKMFDGFLVASVYLDPRATLFGTVGQVPVVCLTLLTGVLLAAGWWRSRAERKGNAAV
ncbi:MAG: apolipoprotein N-acyltransferase [Phycisphaeraceae bacterium]